MEFVMEEKLLRIGQVLEIIPVGKSTWWAGVKDGRFPQAVKFGGITAWRRSDVMALFEKGKREMP
jgi:prophage regulatory protein